MNLTAKEVALVACMAAVYVALSYLPGFPVIGAENVKIGIVSGIAPVFGFILGPWLGALAALIGASISRALTGASLFAWLTLPTMPVSAFVAGALTKPCFKRVRGWQASAFILAILISFWYFTSVGKAVPYFPFLHWIALTIVLVFRGRLVDFFNGRSKGKLTVCIALSSFSSTMAAHMCGTLAFVASAELLILKVSDITSLFISLIPIATIERLIFTAIATAVGVPLILVLRTRFSENC